MKAEKLNRLMRGNGRKQLWLLRNTNKLYENAVKSYYESNSSLLPYNPASKNARERQENRAPIRTLTSELLSCSTDGGRSLKRNQQQNQLIDSGNLLNSVMQANRRRSMSFTAGGVPSYSLYDKSVISASSSSSSGDISSSSGNINGSNTKFEQRQQQQQQRQRQRVPAGGGASGGACSSGQQLKVKVNWGAARMLSAGRSVSLPPRTPTLQLELGMGYGPGKGPPSHMHHVGAMEKSTHAAVMAVTQSRESADTEQLMVVNKALKQRLALRFKWEHERQPAELEEQQPEQKTSPSLAAGFHFGAGAKSVERLPKELARFQTLGERIRQFEHIQFADGPVSQEAFQRSPDVPTRQLAPQQASLSFHNVLHTNHRQRIQSKPKPAQEQPKPDHKYDYMRTKQKLEQALARAKVPPLEPLRPLARNRQQQQQLNVSALVWPPPPTPPSPPLKSKKSSPKLAKSFKPYAKPTKSSAAKSATRSATERQPPALANNQQSRASRLSYLQAAKQQSKPSQADSLAIKQTQQQQNQQQQQQQQQQLLAKSREQQLQQQQQQKQNQIAALKAKAASRKPELPPMWPKFKKPAPKLKQTQARSTAQSPLQSPRLTWQPPLPLPVEVTQRQQHGPKANKQQQHQQHQQQQHQQQQQRQHQWHQKAQSAAWRAGY
ncbi:CG1387 [Drosophila busckii]|uniref:CG1387 n=1 Tax=Drosophila busckii TaxID=30019 RepID=A0A0M4ETC8_DROBS|nr:mediator of RNA polymerase II transcription subunit 15 [Drosophila busckii]ALC48788.1 CG1387 [Drosophila busckii]